jgi:hypothetical protein
MKQMKNVVKGVYDATMNKTIKSIDGTEIERKAHLKVNVPETAEAASELLGADLWKWAVHGYVAHAKIVAANAMTGVISGGDKKLTRAFNESLRTLVDVMEMPREKALATLLAKEKFSAFVAKFEALKSAGSTLELDYTTESLPTPKWFDGDEEESEEETES